MRRQVTGKGSKECGRRCVLEGCLLKRFCVQRRVNVVILSRTESARGTAAYRTFNLNIEITWRTPYSIMGPGMSELEPAYLCLEEN
jgi:hypothetical protein